MKYSLKDTLLNEGFFDIFKKAAKAAKAPANPPEDCPDLYEALFNMIEGGFGEYDSTLIGFVKDGMENGDIATDDAKESFEYALERFKKSKEDGKPSQIDQQIARCIRDGQK